MTNAEALVIDRGETRGQFPEIVRAAKAGDGAAFEEIMLLTERRVAQIAWAVLGDTEEVKDAVQETFLRFFRHIGRYDESKDLFGWLARIAINVCRDALRRRKSRVRIFEPIDETFDAPSGERAVDDDLIRRADLTRLREAIDALPPKERMAVILRDVEGLPTGEVAQALNSTESTVRVQLSRARAKIRGLLESWRTR